MSDRSLAWKSLVIIVALFTAALLPLSAAESARDKLASLEKALDARLLDWEQSLDGARWEATKPGRALKAANFRLRANFQAPAVFAAARVAGTPLAP